MVAQAIRERATGRERAAGHGAQKDRCSVATRWLLAATAKGCGREKRVENETRRDETRRASCLIARKSIKASKGCHEQRDPRCRPGAATAPVPTELPAQVGFCLL